MELRVILLSLMTLIVVGIVFLIVYELYYGAYSSDKGYSPISPWNTEVSIIDFLHLGTEFVKFDQVLPRSRNEQQGAEFSYAAWIIVDNYDYGSPRPVLFVKGRPDMSMKSPAVYLTKGTNEMTILQDTYSKDQVGKVVINNLPAGKFIHLAITLNQKSMDVYINGMIYQHLTLPALPLQNTESLYIADNGGWSGMIGDFTYYNYMLTPGEVHNLSLKKPRRDPNDLPYYPDYLDTSWWMGRA
jgi:hypothetical protein